VNNKTPSITIAICTYNRAHYLTLCLESLRDGIKKYPEIDVLVVDNNSCDTTSQVCSQFVDQGMPLRYVLEKKKGIAHGRNTAYREATGYYVAYIDDDAKAHIDYVDRLVATATKCDYDCFGGMYYAYFETKRPKWLPDGFGTKKNISEKREVIATGFLSAGNFICKREVLEKIGGFDTALGMFGTKVGYGEEDNVQHKMRVEGYQVAWDPKLGVDHVVAKRKLKLGWHIDYIYKQNRDIILSYNPYDSFTKVVQEFIKIAFKYTPRYVLKFLRNKEYYWQNLYIEVVGSYARVLGAYNNKNSFSE
jgi:glycosyltransferase involved in cell wall biosynthesis